MNTMHSVLLIAVVALVTLLLRALPFWVFGGNRKTPALIVYLGKVLPYAIMAMLVVYCLKGVSFTAAANWLPQLIAGAAVVLLQLWKRNTLISVTGGTVLFMILVQLIFV